LTKRVQPTIMAKVVNENYMIMATAERNRRGRPHV
jgi:hypothetical protein